MDTSDASALRKLILSSTEVLYEDAPCGYIFTYPDGLLLKVNRTFLKWFNLTEEEVLGHKKFQELLSVGSRIYYDTNYAPLLRMQGYLNEITLDLKLEKGTMPVLISSAEMKNDKGEVVLIKSTLFDISDRRKYERELLAAKHEAEQAANRAQLLARSGETLRGHSEITSQLQKITELTVEKFSDICFIDLFQNDSWQRVSQDQKNPETSVPPSSPALHKLKETIYLPEIDPPVAPASLKEFIHTLDPQSLLLVPILKNHTQIGLIGFFLTRLGKRFSGEDKKFAEELAFGICSALERQELQHKNDEVSKKLQESHEWFSTTLKSIGDAVLVIDPELKVSYLNRVAEDLTGWKAEEAVGLKMDQVFEIVHEVTGLPALNPVEKVLREGKATVLENHTALIRRDGSRVIIEDSASPIRDEKTSHIHGVVLVFRDTTQKYAEEKKRTELLSELKAEKKVREKFVATLTHDLRSPLASVRLNVDLLRKKHTDEKTLLVTERALKGIARVDSMIQDLLDANRLQAGEGIPLEMERFDLVTLVKDVIDDLTEIHGSRFHLIAPETLEGNWSPDGLRRILENLCNNAIKYGGSRTPVTVKLKSVSSEVELCVHNEGNPLSEDEQKHLFEPFKRLAASRTKNSGWGLGLSLVKGVTLAHGGNVQVESSSEKGTTFRVILPLLAHSP